MMIWGFTSDQHFGHEAVINFCNRPFADAEAMGRAMIERYNAVVPEDATVIHVGDFFLRGSIEDAQYVLAQMHGRKLLVRGNHDGTFSRAARIGFDIITDELQLRIADKQVRVSHFPYAGATHRAGKVDNRFADRRPPRRKGEWLIHGHTHSSFRKRDNMIHVGVDAWDFYPVPRAAVRALIAERP